MNTLQDELDKRASLVKSLENSLKIFETTKEKFKNSLDKNATSALEWSLDLFEASAYAELSERVLNALTSDVNLNELQKMLEKDIVERSRNQTRSTSPTHNLIEQSKTKALATMIETIKWS